MKEKWMNKMQHRMGNYETKAPEGLLDDIKKEMARRGISVVPAEKKTAKVVPMWARRCAEVAALLAITVLIGVLYFNNPATKDIADASKKPSSTMQTTVGSQANNDYQEAEKPSSTPDILTAMAQKAASFFHHLSSSSDGTLFAENQEVSPSSLDKNQGTLNENNVEKAEEKKVERQESAKGQRQTTTRSAYTPQYVYASEHQSPSSFNFGAHYSGVFTNGNAASNGGYNGAMSDAQFDDMQQSTFSNMLPTLAEAQKEEKTHHHQPVKVGVEVRYNIDNKWSVQSGMTYSYLQSDFTSTGFTDKEVTKQRLHYVGIPVNVSYNLYQNKYLNVYVTAGGEVEKMVKGNAETQTSQSGKLISTAKHKVTMNQLQFSTNAAAGVEYKVSKDVSIYAEPGASYYIKNGSDVKTVYSDKPLGFSLNLGVRLNVNR
jgi:hypothetical protein